MTASNELHQHTHVVVFDRSAAAALSPLCHRWPQLGRKLVQLEQGGIHTSQGKEPLEQEQEKEQWRATLRAAIIAQLDREEGSYSRDMRYLTFLLLKQGRAGLIVGNPYTLNLHGTRQELPYTGLEGYYAGVEKAAGRPGLTPAAIIQEEATLGVYLLRTLKQQAIETNSWVNFIHLKQALTWKAQDVETIKKIQSLWATVVRRLHVRLYQTPEFEPTLTEQIEELGEIQSSPQAATTEARQMRQSLQVMKERLQREYDAMSSTEKMRERQERIRRAWIRNNRMEAFRHFHDETDELLTAFHEVHYTLDVQESPGTDVAITETILLPAVPDRQVYPSTYAHLTPQQLEGYLFLAKLGEIGGDPLARSILVTC